MKKTKRIEVWNKYNKHCAYCGCELTYEEFNVDHIQSKLHHEYYGLDNQDRMDNLNPSCRQCNFYKSGGTIEQFRKNLSTLHERLNKLFIVRIAVKYGILEYKNHDDRFYFEKLEE